MSALLEIKAKLDALGSLGLLTAGSLPASPDIIGTIFEYGGKAPERGFGIIGIKYENPAFQLTFRGAPFDYAGPRAKAEIAWRYLPTLQPGALGAGFATVYLTIDPQQSPFPTMPQDANNRYYIGFNFYVSKEPS